MRGYRVQLALIVVLIAVVGAFLHPLALLLAIAPFHTHGVILFLEESRSVIADLLGWAVLSLLAVMVFFVVRGRLARRPPRDPERSAAAAARPLRAVIAITAYNDAAATAQAVSDFRRQPAVSEVLVIDNNSRGSPRPLARGSSAKLGRVTATPVPAGCARASRCLTPT